MHVCTYMYVHVYIYTCIIVCLPFYDYVVSFLLPSYYLQVELIVKTYCEYQKLVYIPYPKTLQDLPVWFYEEMLCPVNNKHVS